MGGLYPRGGRGLRPRPRRREVLAPRLHYVPLAHPALPVRGRRWVSQCSQCVRALQDDEISSCIDITRGLYSRCRGRSSTRTNSRSGGRPYRVLYAFDPRRVALLLLGGAKTGDARWYERMVPEADYLYDRHLEALEREED